MKLTHPWMLLIPLFIVLAATVEALVLRGHDGQYDWRAYFASLGDLLLRGIVALLPLGFAAGALSSLWTHRLYTMLLAHRANRGPVFTYQGDAIKIIKTTWASSLRRSGIRHFRFHDLRHAFGTRMIAKADIRRVQEWMGHADIQTTMR